MTVLRAGFSLIGCLLITALFATTGMPAQADSPYTLEQIKRHLETLYYDQRPVKYRIRDTYAYVYGLSDVEFHTVREVADTIYRQTGQKIIVVNEQGDFGPEIDRHANFIFFQSHMTDQVLQSPFREQFTGSGWSLSDFKKHVAEINEAKGLFIAKFMRSDAEPRDRIIQQAAIFVEKDFKRLGFRFSFRSHVFTTFCISLTGIATSDQFIPSAFNSSSVLKDLDKLPPIDVAYIRALYAHDNWAQLSRGEAIDQLARTMKAFLSAAR